MRETPISDRPDPADEQSPEPAPPRRAVITPTDRRSGGRGETRYWRGGVWRQPPPRRRGPDRRAWVLRGLVGLVVLGGIWLLLQSLFPANEPAEPAAVTQEESPAAPPEAAPAPPPAQPSAPPVVQPTAPPVADRLPGLSGPAAGPADQPSAAPAPAQQPTPAPTPVEQPAPVPTPEQASDESAQDQAPPTPEPIPPPQPIPPPERTPVPAAPVARQAPTPAAKPAAKPTAPPPPPPAAPRGSNGPLTVGASVSPANPVSENAVVTVTVSVTSNGVPVPGAVCTAAVYYRTATVQNAGSVTTGPSGTGAIRIDAQGATYNRFVPVDVTCSTRSGTVATRTGFTPVRAR